MRGVLVALTILVILFATVILPIVGAMQAGMEGVL